MRLAPEFPNVDFSLLEQTFDQALALPAEQREEFLREACGSDTLLLVRLQALLAAHPRPRRTKFRTACRVATRHGYMPTVQAAKAACQFDPLGGRVMKSMAFSALAACLLLSGSTWNLQSPARASVPNFVVQVSQNYLSRTIDR